MNFCFKNIIIVLIVLIATENINANNNDSVNVELLEIEKSIIDCIEINPDNAKKQALHLNKLAEHYNDTFFLAKAQLHIGKCYFINNVYHKALEHQFNAYELFSKISNTENVVNSLINIAATYNAQELYDMAEEYCFNAADIARNNNLQTQLAEVFKTDGYIKLNFDEKSALESLKAAKNLIDSLEINNSQVETNIYLALAYAKTGDIDNAEDILNSNSEIIKQNYNPLYAAKNCSAMASVYECGNNSLKALTFYNKALEICKNNNFKKLAAFIYCKIAALQLDADNVDAALKNAKTALEVEQNLKNVTNIEYLDIRLNACKIIYSCYDKINNIEKKSLYAMRLFSITDSLMKKNNAVQSEIFKINSQIQKQQKEIDLLTSNRLIDNLQKSKSLNIKIIILLLVLVIAAAIFAVLYYRRNRENDSERQKLLALKQKNQNELQERRALEAELRVNEEKYHQIFKNAPVAVIQFDDLKNIISANDRAINIFGLKSVNFVGKKITNFIPEHVFKDFDTILSDKSTIGNRLEFKMDVNGDEKYISSILKPYFYSTVQDIVKGGLFVADDITALKNIENDNINENSGGLINLLPETFVMLDRNNNCEFIQMPGKPDAMQKFLGKNVNDILQYAAESSLLQDIESAKNDNKNKTSIHQARENYYQTKIIPTRNGVLLAIDDVTTQMNVENELKSAKEIAENASKAKSEFLMSITADIRRLLERIKEKLHTDENIDIPKLEKAVSEVLSSVTDFQQLTKVEAERKQSSLNSANPVNIVKEVYEIFEPRAAEKNLYYKLEIDSSIPENIEIDHVRLRQVLFNIVGNAVKFTNNGGVDIKISKNVVGKEHTNLVFTIADTGIGMSQDELEKVFQDTHSTDGTLKQGAGKNLVNSKRLVEAMHGIFYVNTRINEGTSFTITLPDIKTADVLEKSDNQEVNPTEKTQFGIKQTEELRHYAEVINLEIIPAYSLLKRKASFKGLYDLAIKFIEISEQNNVDKAVKIGNQFLIYLKNYDITNINSLLRKLEIFVNNMLDSLDNSHN